MIHPKITLTQIAPGQIRIEHNLGEPWKLVGILLDVAKDLSIQAMRSPNGGAELVVANYLPQLLPR